MSVYFKIMCILFCYVQQQQQHDEKCDIGYELILLSNRDEDLHRPAISAHIWSGTNFTIGGQDLTASREGGTWLCLNTQPGKIGVLVNINSNLAGEKKSNAQSRGFLAPNYVNNSEINIDTYMEQLQVNKMNYTGFSFLGLERQTESNTWRAKYINNIPSSSPAIEIQDPLFGYSNHAFGEQYAFEKTRHGCQLFNRLLNDLTENRTKPITDERELIRRTLALLSDERSFSNDPNMVTVYPLCSPEERNHISSICVPLANEIDPFYATRTSTVILVRRNRTGVFIEKTLVDPMNRPFEWNEQMWEFKLNCPNEAPVRIN